MWYAKPEDLGGDVEVATLVRRAEVAAVAVEAVVEVVEEVAGKGLVGKGLGISAEVRVGKGHYRTIGTTKAREMTSRYDESVGGTGVWKIGIVVQHGGGLCRGIICSIIV